MTETKQKQQLGAEKTHFEKKKNQTTNEKSKDPSVTPNSWIGTL